MKDKEPLIALGIIIFIIYILSLTVFPYLLMLVLGWAGIEVAFWQALLIWILLSAIARLFKN